ncbi:MULTISPECIES: monovalent cation/H(+) antiporter subunit G [Rhizobium]|nr:monovalent cation/H(+) antiporter subunit G [Rhizobium lusitanum]
MMDMLWAVIVTLLLLAGALFSLIAAIGIVRLPDLYSRMHAASKAGTVGSGLLLLAVGIHSQDLSILARALAGFVFFVLTAPISAHLLARAAHKAGHRLTPPSVRDELLQRERIAKGGYRKRG